MIIEFIVFIASFFVLTWLNSHLMKELTRLAKHFGIKEFILAFFILGIAVNLPNLFVDVGSALRNLPQISIGDMIGGNLVDMTLVIALGIFFSKKFISTDSRMVQGSAIFTFFIAMFPLVLLWKGYVTRIDGLLLIAAYFLYTAWAFGKDDRFKKDFHGKSKLSGKQLIIIAVEIVGILAVLLIVSQEIINYTTLFAGWLGTSLSLVSLLLVGLANCFPEIYITITSIRKGQGWVVLGDLMSSVIGAATLVFGIVALVHPFVIIDVPQLVIARVFLVISAIFFLLTIRSGSKLTKREGLLLLMIYIGFLLAEVFVKI